MSKQRATTQVQRDAEQAEHNRKILAVDNWLLIGSLLLVAVFWFLF